VPYHVEIKTTNLHHARAFNLEKDELHGQILEPWMTNRTIELGDQEWVPRESSLRVFEGRRLEGPDLSMGQGWSNAERSGRDVTREALAEAERGAPPPPEALLVEASSAEEALAAIAAGAGGRPIELGEAEAAIDRRDPEVTAIILVTRPRPEPPESSRS
jgi:hypothetical protein